MDENKLLLATIKEKYQRFLERNYLMTTDFLTLQQQAQARILLRQLAASNFFFYGGFEEAERRLLIFAPDYMDVNTEKELELWFKESPQDCPLSLLEVSYSKKSSGKALSHRDFLGSLLAEGIRREKTGDILVEEEGAQIIVERELAPYLEANYSKAGRVSLTVKEESIAKIRFSHTEKEMEILSVSSARLDNVVAAAFGLARKEAVSAIQQGRVFVEGFEVLKPDYNLRGGEKVVLRGKGKVSYLGVAGTSKRGKLHIKLEKYI